MSLDVGPSSRSSVNRRRRGATNQDSDDEDGGGAGTSNLYGGGKYGPDTCRSYADRYRSNMDDFEAPARVNAEKLEQAAKSERRSVVQQGRCKNFHGTMCEYYWRVYFTVYAEFAKRRKLANDSYENGRSSSQNNAIDEIDTSQTHIIEPGDRRVPNVTARVRTAMDTVIIEKILFYIRMNISYRLWYLHQTLYFMLLKIP